MRRIGILTGGGDCPGLNAVIRGVVESCAAAGIEVYGFFEGWRGAIEDEGQALTPGDVEGIQTLGGTILGSSRTNVMKIPDGPARVKSAMEKHGLEGLVAIGGDDTLGVANKLRQMGMNMIGVPKTIDNDLSCTDYTFGFDTAANVAMSEIDRLHTTAAAHSRCFVVECMGRHTGWIALQAGLAANAHLVLIPEFPKSFREIYDFVRGRYVRGERYTLIAVAEGFEFLDETGEDLGVDAFGNPMLNSREVAHNLAARLENAIRKDETLERKRAYFESRFVVLGHLQRGGAPSVFDRVLGARLGVKAGQLAAAGQYGNMVALRGTEIVTADLDLAVTLRKKVDREFYEAASLFFH
ncbi:MAG TPA: ATP-dependent 6-phosphofructokinase [Clostridia bacterium]|nr:MAG: Pyrophosphate--fructose 6-phosphate 1-phosphotransferase [Firmicutes bacterium ADurb.Bin248]HOG01627.1 ATP-dependent 6-phosphofructokinase [Clostridia bacterium]HOS17826.1 ATP-dependent 6-phosphofructokinase [Clostridia bacterium]HPK15993.1 ATP-dependent 6-phosphofructokinase [Clostridia bacterium]